MRLGLFSDGHRLLAFPHGIERHHPIERGLPRRPSPDRHAEHGGQALRALGRLCLRPFRRRRHGHRHQQGWQPEIELPRAPGAARYRAGANGAAPSRRASIEDPRASRRAGRDRPRFRPAFGGFLPRERHASDRRRRLPDRDARNPARHRRGRGPGRALFWRSATPAGRRASWRARSRRMAGCTARPIAASSSTTTSTRNTSEPWPRSASSRRCCRWTPATPDGGRGEATATGSARSGDGARRRTICWTICARHRAAVDEALRRIRSRPRRAPATSASLSAPSAITSMPRSCASATMERRMIGAGGRAVRTHEGPVDLDRVEGEALQVGERGVAGAEIVERQAGAELADARQHLRRIFRVLHHQRLGDLQLQRLRRNAGARQHRLHVVDQIVAQELAAGDIDGDEGQRPLVERRTASEASSRAARSSTIEAELDDETAILRGGNELARRNAAVAADAPSGSAPRSRRRNCRRGG